MNAISHLDAIREAATIALVEATAEPSVNKRAEMLRVIEIKAQLEISAALWSLIWQIGETAEAMLGPVKSLYDIRNELGLAAANIDRLRAELGLANQLRMTDIGRHNQAAADAEASAAASHSHHHRPPQPTDVVD